MNDICTSQTVSLLRSNVELGFNQTLLSERAGTADQAHMEALQLGAIRAQFTLATLYVAPLQHLINTMRNRDSHLCLLAAERPSLNQEDRLSATIGGKKQSPC